MGRIKKAWIGFRNSLASVISVPVGKKNDGLQKYTSGSELDRPWGEIHKSLGDTKEGWRLNPMVRRFVSLITSYVVGAGIDVSTSKNDAVAKFIKDFWSHPQNHMDTRIPEWCDELTRSGEIFVALFVNRMNGMSYVRLIPAELIEEVDFEKDDYETETRYRETTGAMEPDKWWLSPNHPAAMAKDAKGELPPLMLHYAINRPPGNVRGESDLVPVLRWAKRYENWLQDRVRLNIGMRSFYFVIYASRGIRKELEAKYQTPPPSGSVIIAEKDAEEWNVITPNLHARDAKEDGRAIRSMFVAGGPGTSLSDFGEVEESGLSKGTDTNEQRRRFMVRRQRVFSWMIADMVIHAWERRLLARSTIEGTRDYGRITVSDIDVRCPDIAPEDNETLGNATKLAMEAFTGMRDIFGDSPSYRKLALEILVKHLGEDIKEKDFQSILEGDPWGDMDKEAGIEEKHTPKPAPPAEKKKSTESGG